MGKDRIWSQCSAIIYHFARVFEFVIAHRGRILHIDILIHIALAAWNFIGPAWCCVCDMLVFAIFREMKSTGFVLCELCFNSQWKFIYWRITTCTRCVCEWGLRLRCVYRYLKCSVTRKGGGSWRRIMWWEVWKTSKTLILLWALMLVRVTGEL